MMESQTFDFQGKLRKFWVGLPANFDPHRLERYGAITALHGGGGTGGLLDFAITNNTLSAAAHAQGMILCCPEGVNNHWNDGRPYTAGLTENADDVTFIDLVMDKLVARYHADPQKLYVAGISNGAQMTYRLAQDLSDRVSAFACCASGLTTDLAFGKMRQPASMLLCQGTADPLMPYGGGPLSLGGVSHGEVLSADATADHYAAQIGAELSDAIPYPNTAQDGCLAAKHAYTVGKDSSELVRIVVTGGGHTWPGGRIYQSPVPIGKLCMDFSFSQEAVAFFKRHSR